MTYTIYELEQLAIAGYALELAGKADIAIWSREAEIKETLTHSKVVEYNGKVYKVELSVSPL